MPQKTTAPTLLRISATDAANNFGKYLDLASHGTTIIISRNHKDTARLAPAEFNWNFSPVTRQTLKLAKKAAKRQSTASHHQVQSPSTLPSDRETLLDALEAKYYPENTPA